MFRAVEDTKMYCIYTKIEANWLHKQMTYFKLSRGLKSLRTNNTIFFCFPNCTMGRDQPDLSLIVEGAHRTHPSKRVQGQDYPTTVLEEIQQREKGTKAHACHFAANCPIDLPKKHSNVAGPLSSNEKGTIYQPHGN
jgi:hypothetical protein